MKRFTSEELVLSVRPDAGEEFEVELRVCDCTNCTNTTPNNDTKGDPTKTQREALASERDLRVLQRQLSGILGG